MVFCIDFANQNHIHLISFLQNKKYQERFGKKPCTHHLRRLVSRTRSTTRPAFRKWAATIAAGAFRWSSNALLLVPSDGPPMPRPHHPPHVPIQASISAPSVAGSITKWKTQKECSPMSKAPPIRHFFTHKLSIWKLLNWRQTDRTSIMTASPNPNPQAGVSAPP